MDTLEAILTRRSIRSYESKPVEERLVKKIIEAGMSAPSAGNEQPWHFIVIKDREILAKVPEFSPHAHMINQASLGILICGDPDLEKHKGFWVQDCAAAVENMLLAIRALGLGAVWTGVYPKEERVRGFKELLGLPKRIIPLAFIPVGYPAEESKKEDRFKPERIHYEQW
jgi:nitroreductase